MVALCTRVDTNVLIYACDKADPSRQKVALDPVSNAHDGVLHAENGWSFWDAMIVATCLECGVSRFYSEDLPGRAPPGPLEIVNPFSADRGDSVGHIARNSIRIAGDQRL